MPKVRVYENLDECRQLWQNNWTNACVFDLWPVRDCFQKQYNNRPYFLVAERQGKLCGLLALSWIEEKQCFGHFPGEIWQGKTWLEQNKIAASDTDVFKALLRHIPGEANIRYLTRESMLLDEEAIGLDEIGYLFFPGQYGYSFQVYMQQFSGKSRKKLGRELDRLQIIIDVSHSHPNVVDDVLNITTRPVVVSHTGIQSYHDSPRNLSDAQMKRIADKGGIIAIGYWQGAIGSIEPISVVKAIKAAIRVVGVDHVALGSDYDGATETSFDTSELAILTQLMLKEGLTPTDIEKVMGGNSVMFLLKYLPDK